ncbi:MAG TPA: cytochrome c oxidase assembly protein [Bacillus sp. (in: firmicutes)]|uniref:cytochrome c oxidase assembly protein n=1 Tax=Bacillus litorisediminis TaxID=2922713 RepID=UPI001FAF5A8A|nr:cytochrome c oxidase assembly protein [Bacillus litorisediminis]HWO75173.1 cytochrome c oxidase assembly protein [Bacillus sp. (in: firmicutes)]
MKHNHLITPHDLILTIPLLIAFIFYCLAVIKSNASYRKWPGYRMVCWFLGIFSVMIAAIGPVAVQAHSNFVYHMIVHLLLGMLAPLLIVVSQPVTLLLRTLPVRTARKLSRLLKSWPVHVYSHPMVASILNIGGLWVLYTTELFNAMHHNPFIHLIVHFHVFIAGYLFTVSIIYVEPTHRRYSFVFRTIVFLIAFAAHGILAKYMYAHPPNGVPADQAKTGAMLMYYGGDAIDIILIFIFCYQWYRTSRPTATIATVR